MKDEQVWNMSEDRYAPANQGHLCGFQNKKKRGKEPAGASKRKGKQKERSK
jgi:hypothetical protein